MTVAVDSILLHASTKLQLDRFIADPSHAVLLVGEEGAGKHTTAIHLAKTLLQLSADELVNYPYLNIVSPSQSKQSITIDDIRQLIAFTRLKTVGSKDIKRVIIIENAHTMQAEAQNALLKLLEEPPADTVLIATVKNLQALLPTISSRAQTITIHPISEGQAQSFFSDFDPSTVASAWQLSEGGTGLLHALLGQNTQHPLKQAIDEAKGLLAKPTYQKLLTVEQLSRDKEYAALLLNALSKISRALHHQAIKNGDAALIKKYAVMRKSIHTSQNDLQKNVMPKLALTSLFLHL